jgi:hypothetical protein
MFERLHALAEAIRERQELNAAVQSKAAASLGT